MSATNCPETPRQKMISMMYLVYTALLALNVSVEILNGYSLVDGSLRKSISIADARNIDMKYKFESLASQNPAKTKEWKAKADLLAAKSDSLYNYINQVKRYIVVLVDGEEANIDPKLPNYLQISAEKRGNLDITGTVGVGEVPFNCEGQTIKPVGKTLKEHVNEYAKFVKSMVEDSLKAKTIDQTFDTKDIKHADGQKVKWETEVFDGMPAVATLTMLSKLQNDIRNTEAEIMQYLINQIDAGDFRVNKIQALVIPDSKYLIKGGKYHAQIVLAATDSTRPLEVEVNGKQIPNGIYEFGCGSTGKFDYKGKIKMKKPSGEEVSYDFASDYTVGEPSATISADMMNVFYAGISNPLSVSVPGVAARDVSISITNAKQVQTAKGWNITPVKVGVEAVVSVTAKMNGKATVVAKKAFRVKALPPPLAKIEYTNSQGIVEKYKGGTAIAKNYLTTARRIIAELDDADLDVKYKVLSFSLNSFDSMGNTLVEMAQGSELTSRQLAIFAKMTKGKTVYVSNVQAIGPDGIRRTLPPVEVKIK
ncbi:MAG TPA: gliding motility protein GldM [Paludibacteraceae bacterium]|nr:gliding motility protein GldM [Paludibacteraceae bacterium]